MFIEDTNNIYSKDGDLLFNYGMLHLDREDSYNESGHCHSLLEINYVTSGQGKYLVNEIMYDIVPGDIIIFNNTEFHRVSVKSESLELIIFHFAQKYICDGENNISDSHFFDPFYIRSDKFQNRLDRNNPMKYELQNQFKEIETEVKNKLPGYNLFVKIKLLTILSYIARYYNYINDNEDTSKFSYNDTSRMKKIEEYINLSISEEITVAKIADKFHISPTYLYTIFKKAYGISTIQYILKARIIRAIDMLKHTDKNVLDIAQLCGFNSAGNFYKSFKNITGHSPNFYRIKDISDDSASNNKVEVINDGRHSLF